MSTETFTNIDEKLTDLDSSQPLPYWLVNVPRDRWPASCPEFLKDLADKNIAILSTSDSEFTRTSWSEAKELVRTNNIGKFQRVPSDLRKYLEYMYYIKQKYGSVMKFVLAERLHWDQETTEDLKPRGQAFEHEADLKVLYNDWPYGLDPDIVHLVIWTKFELDEDPATGNLTEPMWNKIDSYVQKTFRSHLPADRVIWFKNWKSLKSIHAIEHFHVMLYQPDLEFIKDTTHGDVPLVETISQREP
ncbi:hypothetical protein BGW36DRAFT_399031 [Talaromyces proteolyticus]|uniref:N-acetylglucosamine-induced protein 1 n=1 Tax=Talaromyces proteolyticus TaxID=1131652 RepID=A0AAD4KMK3_9EURO|nr:uncharacterized protein BGW36DRAFT_399031 [Talaromyces proteolyticus]KAH8693770.1 hypothetical protein BGW36DRAFT_399031 [Talaromyces proteolyticus]